MTQIHPAVMEECFNTEEQNGGKNKTRKKQTYATALM